MISSHQIAAMHQQQNANFSSSMGYSQMVSQMSGPGFNVGAAPPPYPGRDPQSLMPQSGGMASMAMMSAMMPANAGATQSMGEQVAGGLVGGTAGTAAFANNLVGTGVGLAGIGAMGASAMGMGGMAGALGMAAGPIGMGVAAGMEGLTFAAENMYGGVQQRQAINRVMRNRFGGNMGIGSGRGGTGFSTEEMGDVSTMVREMSGDDMFTSVEELTRVMDQTAQMKMYRGVQNVKEFKEKFKEMVGGLKEIAADLHTTMEGALELVGQQRQMGIFGSENIEASLMRTRLQAGASGMSMDQMQQVGQMGAQMGRVMGARGRTGARMMQNLTTDVGVGMQMGILSDEMMSEATGGRQGAEAAQALSGTIAQASARFMNRGAGRALTAGLWNPETGQIDEDAMSQLRAGNLDFQDLRRMGRRNIAESGGRRSSFFRDQERIVGEVIAEGGGTGMIAALGEHVSRRRNVDLDDPIMQRFLRRRLGVSQSQVEAVVEMTQRAPEIVEERRGRFRQQLENEARTQARSRGGVEGIRRRIAQVWERDIENPLKQAGDDLVTAFTEGINGMVDEMTGTISSQISPVAKEAAGSIRGQNFLMNRERLNDIVQDLPKQEGGFFAGIGRAFGMRTDTAGDRIRRLGYENYVGGTEQASRELLDRQLSFLNPERQDVLERFGGRAGMRDVAGSYRQFITESSPYQGWASTAQTGWWDEIFGNSSENLHSQWLERANRFAERNESFRRQTRGMTDNERIGQLQRIQSEAGLAGSDYALETMGGGPSGTLGAAFSAAQSAEQVRATTVSRVAANINRESVEGEDSAVTAVRNMQSRSIFGSNTHSLLSYSILGSRGDPERRVRGIDEGAVENLYSALGQNEALLRKFRTISSGDEDERAEALSSLRVLATGGNRAPGLEDVDLNESQQRALSEVVSGEDAEINRRVGMLTSGVRAEGTLQTTARFRETGKALRTSLERSASEVRDALGNDTYESLMDIADKRATVNDRASLETARSAERSLIKNALESGNIDELRTMSSVMGNLGSGGAFMQNQFSRIARQVRATGRMSQRERTEYFLGSAVQGDISRDLMTRIKSGDIEARELIDQEGISLRQGASMGSVREMLNLSEGGVTKEEATSRIIEREQARTDAERIEGAPRERTRPSELMSEQLSQLETLAEYNEQTANRMEQHTGILNEIASNTEGGSFGGGTQNADGENTND